MKKSFLKRAIASAVAVPIALTQCIMPVLAVDVPTDIAVMADTAVTTHLTADSFTNIDPDKTESNWNEVFAGILITQPDFTRDINPSVVTDFIVSNAGNYKDFAKRICSKLNGTTISYTFGGGIVVKGNISDVGSIIGEEVQQRVDVVIADYVKEYSDDVDFSPIQNIDFSSLHASADIEIAIDTTVIDPTKSASVTYKITADDGKTYTIEGSDSIVNYIYNKYQEVRSIVVSANDKVVDSIRTELDDAQALSYAEKLNSIFSNYDDKLDKALEFYTTALNKVGNIHASGSSLEDALSKYKAEYSAKLNAQYPNAYERVENYLNKIPTSATDAVNKKGVNKLYNDILASVQDMIPNSVEVDVDLNALAEIFDNLYNVTLDSESSGVDLVGYMEDDQLAEVEAYYATQGKKVVSSVKKVEATIPTSNNGNIYYNVTRILELEDIESTTTTTSTTTSGSETTTTTVTSDTETGTATTATGSGTGTETGTATTATGTGTGTETGTATTATGTGTGTETGTATTATSGTGTETGTATTATSGTGTETGTATTATGTGTGTETGTATTATGTGTGTETGTATTATGTGTGTETGTATTATGTGTGTETGTATTATSGTGTETGTATTATGSGTGTETGTATTATSGTGTETGTATTATSGTGTETGTATTATSGTGTETGTATTATGSGTGTETGTATTATGTGTGTETGTATTATSGTGTETGTATTATSGSETETGTATTATSGTGTETGTATTATSGTGTETGTATTATSGTGTETGTATTATSGTGTETGTATTATSGSETETGTETTATSGSETETSTSTETTVTTVTTGSETGTETTTTTEIAIIGYKVVINQGASQSEGSFYYSHDDENFFDKNEFSVMAMYESGDEVALTSDEYTLNYNSPYEAFAARDGKADWTKEDFEFEIVATIDGVQSSSAFVYIGKEGDADLNNAVDSSDASNILAYYAALSSGKNDVPLYSADETLYEEFALFLSETNADDAINSSDASNVLDFYAKSSSGQMNANDDVKTFWDAKLPE